MNFSEEDIDQYCKGELSKERSLLLAEAMKHDQDLSHEVQLRLAVSKGLQHINRAALKNTLKGYQQELQEKRVPRLHTMLRIAAVVIPFAIIFAWYFYYPKDVDHFEEYYAYYPNYEANITRGNTDTTLRAQAFIAYTHKDFELAIAEFTNNLKGDPQDHASRFYRGLAYLELNKYDAGLADLQSTVETPSRYATTATWYAALAALRVNNMDLAINYFNALSQGDNSYSEKSREILNQLKRP